MDIVAIGGALTSLKTATDILSKIREARDKNHINKVVSEAQEQLYQAREKALLAQEEYMAILEKNRALEEELERMNRWNEEKLRYKMFSPFTGATLYGLKESEKGDDPPHYICPSCYEEGVRSILSSYSPSKGWSVFRCNRCKNEIQSEYQGPLSIEYVS